jgi:hypothetical protein
MEEEEDQREEPGLPAIRSLPALPPALVTSLYKEKLVILSP